MIKDEYIFSKQSERYEVCGKVLQSIKNTKYMLKIKHVKRYDMIYELYDSSNNLILSENASKDWIKMKDAVNKIKKGKLIVYCIDVCKI